MQDSSPFRWMEDRGPACQLIALIDDATSRIWARFADETLGCQVRRRRDELGRLRLIEVVDRLRGAR